MVRCCASAMAADWYQSGPRAMIPSMPSRSLQFSLIGAVLRGEAERSLIRYGGCNPPNESPVC